MSSNILIPTVGLSFETFEEARACVDDYALQQKFAIILRNTSKNREGKYRYVILACDKHGLYGGKKSEASTKRINCPLMSDLDTKAEKKITNLRKYV